MRGAVLFAALIFSTALFAQDSIPPGTVLPLRLNSSLNSKKVKPGQPVRATLMQEIPLTSRSRLRAGAEVTGRVVSATPSASGGAVVSVQFDTLKISGRSIPITTNLRALASPLEVEGAQLPKAGPDHGTSENAWTTEQVGGDVVYRGGGPVAHGFQVVGEPTFDGVLVHLGSKVGTKCRGEIEGNARLQATWVFSADACGIYGFSGLTVKHAGRTDPVGQITLASAEHDFNIRRGSGLLLRVNQSGGPTGNNTRASE
jgi:hypothetical protein